MTELTPEPFRDLGHCVDSDAVDMVFCDEIVDPFQQLCTDELVLVFEIGQTGQTAVLDSVLVLCGKILIRDHTVVMIIF